MALITEKLKTDLEGLSSNLSELNPPELQAQLRAKIATAISKLDSTESAREQPLREQPLREQMDAAYQARNLIRLMLSGIEIDSERLVKIADDSLTTVEPLKTARSSIESLAEQLYKAKRNRPDKPGETIVIAGAARNIEILEEIARLCIADGINFILDISKDKLDAIMINAADDEGIARLGKEKTDTYKPAKTALVVGSLSTTEFDQDKMTKYTKALSEHTNRFKSGDLDFSLTIIPTENDAELDGIEYNEYMRLFFESCDQPWEAISRAQARLIEKLDKGKELKITNADGTNLTIDIDGFTFANSGADKNVPGSEIFSAPKKEGVNGKLVSKGTFKYKKFPLVRNITLVFENGKIVEAHAEEGEETLKQIIATDEGSHFIGEIAFGTNPHLRRHFVNPHLAEKISKSFHVAIGGCYTFKKYGDQDVNVNNGNKSDIHWDITTMLKDEGSEVHLDGQLLQKNGIWVDETGSPDQNLAVLNYGWGAMPEDTPRPDWWKERYPNGYVD